MTPPFLIRIAMLTGVLMFGGVTWFLRQSEPAPQLEASVLPTLLWMARAVGRTEASTCGAGSDCRRNQVTPPNMMTPVSMAIRMRKGGVMRVARCLPGGDVLAERWRASLLSVHANAA